MSDIAIFEASDGQIQVQLEQDTVWLSQAQIIVLFERDQSVISRHIRNVFAEGELDAESNMQKMHIANSDKPKVIVQQRVGQLVKRANPSPALPFSKGGSLTHFVKRGRRSRGDLLLAPPFGKGRLGGICFCR
jgi:hypothetical protein